MLVSLVEFRKASERLAQRCVALIEGSPERVRYGEMNDKQTPSLEPSIKALPTALFSARHLSTLLTSSGVLLPA